MKQLRFAYYICVTLLGVSSAMAMPRDGSDEDTGWRRIKLDDLDLNREPGAAALYSRIHAAARAVCPEAPGWQNTWLEQARTCRFQAVARAIADVNAPKLTSYYEAKHKARQL